MKNVGIVCEYNPFHNGHARQIRAVHAAGGAAVCLMSGNYVQRGEPALLDKQTRAKAAVLGGADLVLELPVSYVLRSAEGFADGGVEIFNAMGCIDALCFGTEIVNHNLIMSTAKALLSKDFSERLKERLSEGISFPAARQRALQDLGVDTSAVCAPNAILAVEYCKALLRRSSTMTAMPIHREGAYHGGSDPEQPSASFLRGRSDWSGYVPENVWALCREAPRHTVAAGERAWLARLRAMTEEEFEALPFGSEGLWRRLMHACRTEASIDAIVDAAKSKRYTHTRLMRMLLCAYLGIDHTLLQQSAPYVRVLATNACGQTVLRQVRKQGTLRLLHAGEIPPDGAYAKLERRVSDLYGLFRCGEIPPAGAERRLRLYRKTDV